MKKLLFALLIAASLTSCDRDDALLVDRPYVETWYGRVRVYYRPEIRRDTVWRLRMVDENMKREYEYRVGYIYEDRLPEYLEVGQMWEVQR